MQKGDLQPRNWPNTNPYISENSAHCFHVVVEIYRCNMLVNLCTAKRKQNDVLEASNTPGNARDGVSIEMAGSNANH
jgi:hypothetical protein